VTKQEYITRVYHDLFFYTLSPLELQRWYAGKKLKLTALKQGKKKQVKVSRRQRIYQQASSEKLKLAHTASAVLQKIPFIMFVGITGSLAMNNASPQSDIDLMIITQENTLWFTRLISITLLSFYKFKLRRAGNSDEVNRLCMNLWIDESALMLPHMPHNAYTSHEVAQVVPLVNKARTYERWISKNTWVLDYWPYAVHVSPKKQTKKQTYTFLLPLIHLLNLLAFKIQKQYMQKKITRERVAPHYAYFHPFDWGDVVMKELSHRGVVESVK